MSKAAFLQSTKTPFQVLPTPIWDLTSPNEILIRAHAVAINPVDKMLQYNPAFIPMTYPAVLGQDVAGEVVAVGDTASSRFKVGDRVIGHCLGIVTKRPQDGAFQEHVVLESKLVSKIPDGISYERAVVIPLGLSTAAAGLYQEGFMGLRLPGTTGDGDEVVFIWGGSSSVGCNAIQLAVAAGYEVVTTASDKNAEYLRKLGAKTVLDRRSGSIREDILAALEGKKLAGTLDCIGGEAWAACLDVVGRHEDGSKLVITTKHGYPEPAKGLSIKNMFATTIKDNEVGKAIYEDFLPKALEEGTFVPAPEPDVVGKGLESIQAAVDLYRGGTPSAKKWVVLI